MDKFTADEILFTQSWGHKYGHPSKRMTSGQVHRNFKRCKYRDNSLTKLKSHSMEKYDGWEKLYVGQYPRNEYRLTNVECLILLGHAR